MSSASTSYYHTTIVAMLCVIIFLQLLSMVPLFKNRIMSYKQNYTKPSGTLSSGNKGTCNKDTCGAIDDVNNPSYNMQNIVKQSILLEEHIAEKNKYCISCIVKHFQHIIGLAEEAVWLAGPDLQKYPHLEVSVPFYQELFVYWKEERNNDKTKKDVLLALRERRRQLIDEYFLREL